MIRNKALNRRPADSTIHDAEAEIFTLKLHYKFFILFILNSVLIMALLAGTLQFFIYQNFADYVNHAELSKLSNFVAALKAEYVKYKGWDSLKEYPQAWNDMLLFSLMKDHPKAAIAGSNPAPPGSRNHRPPRQDGRPRRPPPRHPEALSPVDPLQIGQRLSLFDTERRHVAGRNVRDEHEQHTFREINVNGNTVGWLALNITEKMYHPLAIEYVKNQIDAFYIIAGCIMALSVFLSFLISRQLLRPVRQLTKGTEALMSFRFDMKIEVGTKDELGKLAEDFNRMAETLRKYEELRQQWVSDISHELRTPLTIMRGKIEATLDGVRELTEDTMLSLHSDVIRLGKLVDDLHLLSLADSQNLRMRKEALNPLKTIRDTTETFRTMLDHHGIRLQTDDDIRDAKHVIMEGDRDHLGRLFSNLLENTVRYTDSPGLLRIHAASEENRLILCFEDSGPGVPDEALERIFDRLYRVDKSRSRKLGGSGLGLSICKQIVESHKGSILADHAPSGGLRITVEFPLISDRSDQR